MIRTKASSLVALAVAGEVFQPTLRQPGYVPDDHPGVRLKSLSPTLLDATCAAQPGSGSSVKPTARAPRQVGSRLVHGLERVAAVGHEQRHARSQPNLLGLEA